MRYRDFIYSIPPNSPGTIRDQFRIYFFQSLRYGTARRKPKVFDKYLGSIHMNIVLLMVCYSA